MYFIALFALPAAFGARAAFYAEPISDILGPVVSIAVYALAIRRILRFPPAPLRRGGDGRSALAESVRPKSSGTALRLCRCRCFSQGSVAVLPAVAGACAGSPAPR